MFKVERLAFVLTLCAVVVAACGRSDAPVQMKAARGGPVAGRTCGAGPAVLTGNGIGTLRIGRPAADIKRECNVVADTSVEDAEGMLQRVLFVRFGSDTVEAEISDGRVWRLAVRGRSIRTPDSLGVGTRLSQLRRIPDLKGAAGEGMYALADSRCGLSFELSSGPGVGGAPEDLGQYSDSVSVTRVLVVGCARE